MLKKTKNYICQRSDNYKTRFVIDLFMFSTLFNGINCHCNQNQSDWNERSFGLGSTHRVGFFGHRKRLQFALLPIMYKMGVMTTLLTGLTVLALKGLTIGVILLFFAFGNHFVKYGKLSGHSSQPIHVHVHPNNDKHVTYTKYHDYGGETYSGTKFTK
ncbi:hypothetical protein Phum_PHUM310400 [Pediculus humanus corporis]|uniref:Uncharacterized protein n=1 Tax=Pediculus humanus subsp. corporis TaxID=121224 RepID=E0VMI7_PEDHC|nr:uncharacterized protein Phum_PHUM310400 [Pediculus humanus corporis]EEB14593.1 hypothetical protein Phum_PHUM310400 [Pediculus humanus corporis]